MKFVEAGKLKDNLANYLRDLPKWLRFALIFAPYVTLFYFDLSFGAAVWRVNGFVCVLYHSRCLFSVS